MPEKPTRGEDYKASEESSRMEIVLGKGEGEAYGAALAYLTNMEANNSGQKAIDDYVVAYAFEDAEGLYHMHDGKLEWHEPTEYNCHVEVAVRSSADGRFVPGLTVHATLLDDTAKQIASDRLPFLWHPWIYHYGRNWSVPKDGDYRLRVHIDAPDFPRHDAVNGKRFEKPVDVEFMVHIKSGRKLSKAA